MRVHNIDTNQTYNDYRFNLDKYIGKDVWILVQAGISNRWIKILDVHEEALSHISFDDFGNPFVDEDATEYYTYYTIYSLKCRSYGPIDLPKYPLDEVCSRTLKIDEDDITVYLPLEVRSTDELFETWEGEY